MGALRCCDDAPARPLLGRRPSRRISQSGERRRRGLGHPQHSTEDAVRRVRDRRTEVDWAGLDTISVHNLSTWLAHVSPRETFLAQPISSLPPPWMDDTPTLPSLPFPPRSRPASAGELGARSIVLPYRLGGWPSRAYMAHPPCKPLPLASNPVPLRPHPQSPPSRRALCFVLVPG